MQADPKFAGLKVGVLALQGAFAEHCDGFRRLGVKEVREVRVRAELEGLDGLAMPGGESTAMVLIAQPNGEGGVMKVSEEHDILSGLTDWVHEKKMPTWGTCAGMILLSDRLTKDTQKIGGQGVIGGFDMTVSRNFFGRQLQSFEAPLTVPPRPRVTLPKPSPIFERRISAARAPATTQSTESGVAGGGSVRRWAISRTTGSSSVGQPFLSSARGSRGSAALRHIARAIRCQRQSPLPHGRRTCLAALSTRSGPPGAFKRPATFARGNVFLWRFSIGGPGRS